MVWRYADRDPPPLADALYSGGIAIFIQFHLGNDTRAVVAMEWDFTR